VGKSTLFNRILGTRHAVVSDIPGTTRDRLERTITWGERQWTLVDMAGLEPSFQPGDEISAGMQEQVQRALGSALLVVWVVDAASGPTSVDSVIAELLRRIGKPVVVAANKCDHPQHELRSLEFAEFGFEPIIALSAFHDRGTTDLLQAIAAALPTEVVEQVDENREKELYLAIAGRPNVGKSTLINALVGEARAVVSAVAGTTRDAVDTLLPAEALFGRMYTRWEAIRLIDTAGIRRRGKIDRSVEGWSVLRSYAAIDEADVVLLLIDATEQLVHQDTQVLDRIVQAGKPFILLVNKWDAVLSKHKEEWGGEQDDARQALFLDRLRRKLAFAHWAPVLFLSAKEQLNTRVIGRLVNDSYIAWSRELTQADLDELATHLRASQPRLRNLTSLRQTATKPPVFHIDMHGQKVPHFSTRRAVENALRDTFNLGPTPIKIWAAMSGDRVKDKDA
jgi:GTP-binding protein